MFNDKLLVKSISKFPPMERDLALLVDKNVTCQQIIDCIKSAGGEFLKKVSLFDIYEGNQVEKGKKSLAFNLLYVSDERTLVVDEIENSIQNILKNLRDQLKAELR
jgi:phenylalanyl-tRNA synthetase beta chain